jgi:peroxiredoxin
MRQLVKLQDEVEVAYTRMISVTVDPPEVTSAFRAGLGARWTILSDHERRWIDRLDLEETTDALHRPYVPFTFTLYPDLTIHAVYDGYWFWGRATLEELRRDMRAISRAVRKDFDFPGGHGRAP